MKNTIRTTLYAKRYTLYAILIALLCIILPQATQAAAAPVCGDGICNGTETCSTCPQDCGTCPVSCNDYISYWKFDGDANDETGVNNGTFYGNATTIYDSERDYNAETNGYVLSLDGAGDYINVGDPADGSLDMGTNSFTMSFWIKTDKVTGNPAIIWKRSGNPGYRFELTPTGGVYIIIINATNQYTLYSAGSGYNDGKWHHLVAVINRGSNISFYADGSYKGAVGSTLSGSIDNSGNLQIGKGNYGDFDGTIDDVMIFNRSLSADEIQQIYNAQRRPCIGITKCSSYTDSDSCTSNPCGVDGSCEWDGINCFTAVDTWYVRPAGGDYGSENGISYENAWDGLENVVWGPNGVNAGDTLYICGLHLRTRTGGSAWEYFTPRANGVSEDSRITIRGDYPGDQGIVWGAGIMAHEPWVDEGNNTWSITAVGTPNSMWYFEDITADSWKVLDRVNSLEECKATPGSYYSPDYTAGSRFYVHTSDNGNPTGRIAANRLGYNLYVNDDHYITWKNLEFYGIHSWINYGSAPYGFVTYMKWENCTIWYGDFIHFLFRNNNHHNEFIDCDIGWAKNGIGFAEYPIGSGSTGDGSEPHDFIIRGCKFHHIGIPYGTSDSHAIAGQGSRNILIENNEMYLVGTGVTFYCYNTNQAIKNITIRYNWVHDTHSDWGANSRGIEFNTGGGSAPPGQAPGTSADVYNNIVGPNVSDVGYNYKWEESGEFYNNICYDCGTSFYISGYSSPVRAKLRNNISLNPRDTHIEYRSTGSENDYSIDSDYNLFYPISGQQFFFYEYALGGGPDWGWKNFTEWQALSRTGSTFDPHSIVADPMFVDPDNGDFRLRAGSPAIDAGIDVGLTKDFSGKPIPQGVAFDIGAYEYVPQGNILYGDVSGDGEISAYDAALTAQAAVELISLTAEQTKAADVSGDSEVTAYDAALIAQYSVGLISKFPVEE